MNKLANTIRVIALLAISAAMAAILFLYLQMDLLTAGLIGALVFFAISYLITTTRYSAHFDAFHTELIEYRKDTDQIIRKMSELRKENTVIKQDIERLLAQNNRSLPDVDNEENSDDQNTFIQSITQKSIDLKDKVTQKTKAFTGLTMEDSHEIDETPNGSLLSAAKEHADEVASKIKSVIPNDLGAQATQSLSRIQEKIITEPKSNSDISSDPVSHLITKITDNSVEIGLQPILEIPHRRLKFYDTKPQIPHTDGVLLDIYSLVPKDGIMPFNAQLDAHVIPKIIAVSRRIAQEMSDVKIFCSITPALLKDANNAEDVIAQLDANRILKSDIVFKMPQREYERMSSQARENWTHIMEMGFKFCLEQPEHFRFDAVAFQSAGIDFIKIPYKDILNLVELKAGREQWQALYEDLTASNIRIISDHVNDEQVILELLDLDITFAQGDFLAETKLVKSDIVSSSLSKNQANSA